MQRFKYAISKLSYPIDPDHRRDFFINSLLPMTRIPPSQQNIDTLQDALEHVMQIEAMEGYPHDYKIGSPFANLTIMELQKLRN